MTRRNVLAAGAVLPVLGALPVQAQAGPVLNIGMGPELDTLDPHRSSTIVAGALFAELWEGLTTFAADGTIVPGVAQRWQISADGLTWTFHLRDDARWSDGSPVTADDFVFSWRRVVTPSTRLGLPEWVSPIRNALSILRQGADPASLGVTAPDARTLVVTLEHPKPDFTVYTAYWVLSPLHHASLAQHGDAFTQPGKLISNGPFMLTGMVPQSHYAMAVNPYFHAAKSIAVSGVNYHVTEDLQTELKRFRAGELHATREVPPSQLDWVRANLGDNLHLAYRASTFFLVPNLMHAPWKDNPDLCVALSMAIDRKVIVEKITKGGELPAWSMTPPGLAGYSPPRPDWADLEPATRAARARALFAKAGYGPDRPLSVELLFNTNELYRQVAVAIAAMWHQTLGVETTLSNQEFKVVVSRMKEHSYPDFARITWAVGLVTEYLNLLRSRVTNIGPGYANPALDAAMEAVDQAVTLAEFRDRLATAERIAQADMPMIPVMHQSSRRLVSASLRGWIDNAVDLHSARYLSLA